MFGLKIFVRAQLFGHPCSRATSAILCDIKIPLLWDKCISISLFFLIILDRHQHIEIYSSWIRRIGFTFEDSFGTWKRVNSIWEALENIHSAINNSLISRRQTQCMMQSTSSWRRVLRVGSRVSKILCSTTSTPSRPSQAPCARCKASSCETPTHSTLYTRPWTW